MRHAITLHECHGFLCVLEEEVGGHDACDPCAHHNHIARVIGGKWGEGTRALELVQPRRTVRDVAHIYAVYQRLPNDAILGIVPMFCRSIAGSSNGRTSLSGSENLGSSPGPAAKSITILVFSAIQYLRMTKEQVDLFYNLETGLHTKDVRNSREKLSALLADDFVEFGKSGGVFNKENTLEGLGNETVDLQIIVSDFSVKELSAGVVLVMYAATMFDVDGVTTVSTNRSSVWVLRDSRWQMVFHQGTKKVL